MSLFAFGDKVPHGDFSRDGITLHPKPHPVSRSQYLLAFSPHQFNIAASYMPDIGAPPQATKPITNGQTVVTGPFGAVELPRISVTNNDVKLRLPVFDVEGVTVAVLQCRDADGDLLGFLLLRDEFGRDPVRPRYFTGVGYKRSNAGPQYRARLRTIFMVSSPPDRLSPGATTALLTINCTPASPFRFPHWLVSRFVALRFRVWESRNADGLIRMSIMRPAGPDRIWLDLGICKADAGAPLCRWSKVTILYEGSYMPHEDVSRAHDCTKHHIDCWTAQSKDFGDADRTVRVSFTPCKRSPETTRVVHIELFGRVYAQMLLEATITFPSLDDRHKGVQPRSDLT
ncbi:hypothetical protein BD310DRAFT_950596 [Dichomitus squalens]|uniref:Uncharacterized protein n=1 Tax=Dichomitus squalens TaxID=114155 RepID=A0A4Q9PN52_9APHY|nr:hypothetical protein BD310DRAFT_950596 [Dichomitus squalens]